MKLGINSQDLQGFILTRLHLSKNMTTCNQYYLSEKSILVPSLGTCSWYNLQEKIKLVSSFCLWTCSSLLLNSSSFFTKLGPSIPSSLGYLQKTLNRMTSLGCPKIGCHSRLLGLGRGLGFRGLVGEMCGVSWLFHQHVGKSKLKPRQNNNNNK